MAKYSVSKTSIHSGPQKTIPDLHTSALFGLSGALVISGLILNARYATTLLVDEPTYGGLFLLQQTPLNAVNRLTLTYRLPSLELSLVVSSSPFPSPPPINAGYALLTETTNLTMLHDYKLNTNYTLCLNGLNNMFHAAGGEIPFENESYAQDTNLAERACRVAYPVVAVSKVLNYVDKSTYFMKK